MAKEDKFADELLSEDELDNVIGGTCYELADDSRFLNSLNNSTDRYGATKLAFLNSDKIIGEIIGAWLDLGVLEPVFIKVKK